MVVGQIYTVAPRRSLLVAKLVGDPVYRLLACARHTVPQGGLYGMYVDEGHQEIPEEGVRMVGLIKLVL